MANVKHRELRPYRFPAGKRFDVVGFGLSSVDHLCIVNRHPRLDSKQQIVTYDQQPGGQVPTALVALQRWGLRTAYVGTFGDDAGGASSRAALADEGVDLSACVTRHNTRQQVSVILIDEVSGERSVLSERVPELVLHADELPRQSLTNGSVLLMDAVDMPAAIVAARAAKDEGILTVLDTDTPAPRIDELLRLTDVLIVGAEFPARLTGISDLRKALRHTAKRGPWFAGVTLGPGGALALVHGALHYVPAFRVPVVDSTGAGDIFHAGSIYGLLQGWPVPDILRFASAAAALKCEKLGGRPGIPSLERATALARSG
ncbi:MAG TPA: PfkB family carbohydrate kinase [Candidatus Binatia bacterium]